MLEVLEKNAIERLIGAEHLLEQGLFTTSLESSFFAVEIVVKAYVAKKCPELGACQKPQDAKRLGSKVSGPLRDAYFKHDLAALLSEVPEVREQFMKSSLPESVQGLLDPFAADGSFWEPRQRYVGQIDENTARNAYNFAKVFQKWMLETFLKP